MRRFTVQGDDGRTFRRHWSWIESFAAKTAVQQHARCSTLKGKMTGCGRVARGFGADHQSGRISACFRGSPASVYPSALILVVNRGLRAYVIVRSEDGKKLRGSPPENGNHTYKADTNTGGGCAGVTANSAWAKGDPQAYARAS